MRMFRFMLAMCLVSLLAPAAIAQRSAQQAPPGTVNYVEGSVAIDGQHLTSRAVGYKVLQSGQVLSTTKGRVEILLTPGIFLRLGHNSAIQMISPDLTKTQLRLTRGRATVEVDNIFKQNRIEIAVDGVMTRLVKPGLYEYNAHLGRIRTFDGRALVYPKPYHRPVRVRTAHELMLPPAAAAGSDTQVTMHKLRAHHFNRKRAERHDPLLAWSKLRSKYLAQANEALAYRYAGYRGFVPGWYWNPWGLGYTWLPGAGMYWNPFGWGFYSPVWMYYGYGYYPYYGGYYGAANSRPYGRVLPGRRFDAGDHWNRGPARGPMPVRGGGFHPSHGFGGSPVGGGFHGGGIHPSAGGFGGGALHAGAGGHPH